MFLALINDTYSEVKAELAVREAERLVTDYFKQGYSNVLGRLGSKDGAPQKIMQAMQAAYAEDEKVSYAELRQNLKKSNFSNMEIELVMSQYDTNEDECIDEEEAIKVFQDLSGGKHVTGLQDNLKFFNLAKLPVPNDADIEKYY